MDLVLRRPRRRPRGFTLIEVLVGLFFLLVIALGVLPIFFRSSIENVAGKEATDVTNLGRSELEEFRELPFNGPNLTIDAGTEKTFDEYFSAVDKKWKPGPAPTDGTDPARWTRNTVVRQYGASALDDGKLEPSEALPAGTDPSFVHIKEIHITLDSHREGAGLGPAKGTELRVLKAQ